MEGVQTGKSGLKARIAAHIAAATHRWPARDVQIIAAIGYDGTDEVIALLGSILKITGERIGIIGQNYVEVAGERASGSDQASPLGDAAKLHGLLSHMRKAGCKFVLIDLPPHINSQALTALPLTMVIMRRCGDANLDAASIHARVTQLRRVLAVKPRFTVLNRDDACFAEVTNIPAEELSITYGTHPKAECRIVGVKLHSRGTAVKLIIDHQTEIEVATEYIGKRAAYSAVGAVAAAYLLHVPIEHIEEGMHQAKILPAHTEYLPFNRPFDVVLDGAITPEGIMETLESLKHFAKNRIIAVIGNHIAIPPHWRPIIGEIVANQTDRIIVNDGEWLPHESATQVREQFLQGVLAANADARCEAVPDRAQALEKALSIARRGDIIIVLASPQRPYRQLGTERQTWSDHKQISELLLA